MLYAGDAAWRVEIALLLALQRVGCMVGGDGVDGAVNESAPQCQAVVVALDGWVALNLVA